MYVMVDFICMGGVDLCYFTIKNIADIEIRIHNF